MELSGNTRRRIVAVRECVILHIMQLSVHKLPNELNCDLSTDLWITLLQNLVAVDIILVSLES